MSKDKNLSIFSPQMVAIVFIILQIRIFKQGRVILETVSENYLTLKQLCKCPFCLKYLVLFN